MLLLLLTGLCACASAPDKKQLKTDEEYYNRAMNLFNEKNYFDAIPAFEELKEKFPLSPYAIIAEMRLGDAHFYKEEYVEAIHMFENFRRLHPNNKSVPYSIYMTGMCYYNQILTIDRDTSSARAAAEQFQQLIELYPDNPYGVMALVKLGEARRVIAEHEFFIGEFYLRNKNYTGAINRFNGILKDYPSSVRKDRIIFYLAQANFLSENRARGQKFLEYLIRKYPDSPYAAQAKTLLALPKTAQEKNKRDVKEAKDKKQVKRFLLF
ncbi:MAG: outer membrane protein assembly factor BamD [Proteobacteria bacterium]|nr:outer membrane protein assembly factor BamD [Pseudomonadota bacterium]